MKPIIVIAGFFALLATSQAQSADGENKIDPSSAEVNGNLFAYSKPVSPGYKEVNSKPGLSGGKFGSSFHAHGNSVETESQNLDQQQLQQDSQPQSQSADIEESKEEQAPNTHIPIREPIFFNIGSGNQFGGDIIVNKPSATTTTWPTPPAA